MKLYSFIAAVVLLSTSDCQAQIKNAKTATVKVYGNCGMCETTIEKAASKSKVSKANWNEETQMATITYDSNKTNVDVVLKNIALAGYDNQSFLAPEAAYNKLPGCCKYNRKAKPATAVVSAQKIETKDGQTEHNHGVTVTKPREAKTEVNQTLALYDNYFSVKDALVKTDAKVAAEKAAALLASLNGIDMSKMNMDDHMAFMKVEKALKADATTISTSQNISTQRNAFRNLSTNMITFMKVTKTTEPVYLQHCPMANNGKGADWLSKESSVKNPYYGAQMLSCGKTVETIQR